MTAEQFLTTLVKGKPPAVSLFLGPDAYMRKLCKDGLVAAILPTAEDRESGWSRWDLAETSIAKVLDDASAMSLFASNRVIWVAGAEAAVPKGRAKADEDTSGLKELEAYLGNPTPGTTIVFDCSRYDFDGDDKTRVENLRKFYSAVKTHVEFPRFSKDSARSLALELAAERKLKIGPKELELLLEATGADAARVDQEIEKLSLYATPGVAVTMDDLNVMVPNARAANIFALVAAIGKGDRIQSLDILDTLVREGEYLPLALNFLATQFRLALAAHEAKLKGAMQIQAHFTKSGIAMWKARAEQVEQTVNAFTIPKLKKAIGLVYEADQSLKDTRPDDRTVIEEFIWKVTAKG
jgi:DNA polymerase III subunit delta